MNTAESRSLSNARPDTDAEREFYSPAAAEPLSFELIREKYTEIWHAALDADVTISQKGRPDLFLLSHAQGGGQLINASLLKTASGVYEDWCCCSQFDEHSHCEHLCAIRQHDALGLVTIPET